MTRSLRARRELIEEIDEVIRGALTCPVCQNTLAQDPQEPHKFMCMSLDGPCIYIDVIISSPLLDEQTSESPLPDERPTDTSWRNMLTGAISQNVPDEKPEPFESDSYNKGGGLCGYFPPTGDGNPGDKGKPKRKPSTSYGTKGGIHSQEVRLYLTLVVGIVTALLVHMQMH